MSEVAADVARRGVHLLKGRLFNRPPLLARVTRALQWGGVAIACTPQEVQDVCLRTADFSNVAHADKLVAGPFVIGMDSGPVHARERAAASHPLKLARFGDRAADEARRRLPRLRARLEDSFDLVDDYLAHVAWAGLGSVFDAPARDAIEGVAPGMARDAALQSLYFELRQVGGHLVVGGSTAPRAVQVRAAGCAVALNRRVERALPAIEAAWRGCPHAAASAHRQAVGLMWVGHPAMVQAGVFVFQELRARPAVYAALRAEVEALGSQGYADAALRRQVRAHVLECLRHRPPFPALPRLAPLGAQLRLRSKEGAARPANRIAAGGSVMVSIVSALRDAPWGDAFRPEDALALWNRDKDALPIFGVGGRSCIARDDVLELLVSAMIGLLQLPALDYADRWWRRLRYDGPIVTGLRLKVRV